MERSDDSSLLAVELTRRRFINNLLRSGAGFALLSSGALAACSSDSDTNGQAVSTGADTTAATPSTGGTITFGTSTVPSGFDPQVWWNATSWQASVSVFDRLFAIQADGSLAPELLETMPTVENDGLLYTFKLRPGVMFTHGRELTSSDVKYTLERLVAPATESQAATLYTGLKIPGMEDVLNERANELSGVKVVDDQTFTVELEQPDSVFLYLLSINFMGIVPQEVVEESGDKWDFAPVGSGPYVLKEVDPSKSLVLERNPDYWKPNRPYADRVEWTIGLTPDLSVLRIQSGELDMMSESIPQGSFDQLRNDPAVSEQLVIGVENNVYYITLSLKHEALKDIRVRQAIGKAIDKERLVRSLKGLADPGTGGLFSPVSPYFQDGLAQAYDPEGAKALLAEAGFADGFDVTFWTPDFTPRLEIGQTAQQDLEAIGIRVDLQQTTRDAYLAEIAKMPSGIVTDQWPLGYPHGSSIMDAAFTTAAVEAGCCNYSNWTSKDFDALVAEAHVTTDPDELVRLYKEMDAMVIGDETLWVPMIYPHRAEIVSTRLKGFEIPPWPTPEQKFFADYWVEA
jgi:peptide/nickel transport system substrate-binding protein